MKRHVAVLSDPGLSDILNFYIFVVSMHREKNYFVYRLESILSRQDSLLIRHSFFAFVHCLIWFSLFKAAVFDSAGS